MNLLDKIKEQGLSVSLCARIIGMSKRTLQDHLDVPSRMPEREEKQIKMILNNYKDLEEQVKGVKV